jgi:hypothetical protein
MRSVQRNVPPIVIEWLRIYGVEEFDGHGGVIRYFSRRSRRRLEREVGQRFVCEVGRYLDRYLVESAADGTIITMGIRLKPVRHR